MNNKVHWIIGVFLFGLAQSAAAVPVTYSTGNVAVPIVSNTTATSFLDGGDSGTITDVDVFVDIDHTWTSDLVVSIEHGGITVQLFDRRGGADDDIKATFDDEAATAIWDGANPFAGSFRPESALSAFDGIDVLGGWTLSVADLFSGDEGTINSWGIAVDGVFSSPSPVPSPSVLSLLALGLLTMRFLGKRNNT